MKTFNKFLIEATDKGAVFSFGRFNPPTTGHAKLVDKLKQESSGYTPLIFTSHSTDTKKNPLTHKDKIKFLRKFFGRIIVDSQTRTVFEIAVELHNQKYNKIKMVVGSDRIREFEMLLKKYNGVKARHGYYKFDDILVVSAGERDPDADDTSGMSASKLRGLAQDGRYDEFAEGVPTRNKKDKELLYKAVRKGMGIAEGNLPTYMYEDLITEGVYDPGTFKAVFFSGGPGSGKSTVVDALSLKSLGLKLVNTDKAFELGLKKAGMTLDLRGADFDRVDPIRAKAKKVTGKGMDMYMDGRLGLIFDTTSANLSKVKQYKEMLDGIGYECKMIHVSTSLANAQKRNAERPRKLPPEIVEKDWDNSTRNMIALQRIFKGDFLSVSNDDDLKSLETKANKLYSKLMSWTTSFPSNKLAIAWKERELHLKKTK
jgi:predicted kinase